MEPQLGMVATSFLMHPLLTSFSSTLASHPHLGFLGSPPKSTFWGSVS